MNSNRCFFHSGTSLRARAHKHLRFLLGAATLTSGIAFGPTLVPELRATTEADFNLPPVVLSINFGAQAVTAGSPGAVSTPFATWNNMGNVTNGTNTSLKDSTGGISGVTVVWTASGTYNSGAGTTTANGQLTRSYIDDNAAIDPTVTLTGLSAWLDTATSYTAYVILGSDQADGYLAAPYQINGTWYYGDAAGHTAAGTQASTWNAKNFSNDDVLLEGKNGSYLKVEGLTADTLVFESGRVETGGNRGPIAGIQVVTSGASTNFRYWVGGNATWDATANSWRNDSAGGAANTTWGVSSATGGQTAVFASGATVNVSGTHYSDGLWVKSGAVTLNGTGVINFVNLAKIAIDTGTSLTLDGTTTLNIPDTAVFTVEAGGTLNVAKDLTLPAPVGGTGAVNISSGTLTFAPTSTVPAGFSHALGGTGNVAHSGTGTTVFSVANNYSGSTTIAGGNLRLDVANAIANSSGIQVNAGTLTLGAAQSFKNLAVGAAGTLAIGSALMHTANQTVSFTMTNGGTVTFATGAKLVFNVGVSGTTTALNFGTYTPSNIGSIEIDAPGFSSVTGNILLTGNGITSGTPPTLAASLGASSELRWNSSASGWELFSTAYYVRTWTTEGNGGWTEASFGNWAVSAPLPVTATTDRYILAGGTTNTSRTITIPAGTVVHLDGTQEARLGAVVATRAVIGSYTDANLTNLATGAGLYIGGRTYDAAAGTSSAGVNDNLAARWTIQGGILDTGPLQPDGHWAIWVSRGEYGFDNQNSEVNLNIKSTLTGAGNIILQHGGKDNAGLLIKGDASQFSGSIIRTDGSRYVGFTGDASIGAAYIWSDQTLQVKDVNANTVFGAAFQGRITFNTNAYAVALTGGTYTGGFLGTTTFKTNAAITIDSGTVFAKGGALGTGTTTLNNAVLQFFGSEIITGGIINLNNGGARIKVGGDITNWIYGTAASYGLPDATPITSAKGFTYADSDTAPITVTYAGSINGGNILTKIGAGKLILTGTGSSRTGGTTINEGTISIGSDANLTTSPAGIHTINGGALELTGADGTTYTRAWTVAGSTSGIAALHDVTLTALNGNAPFKKTDTGTLTLTEGNYSGVITVSAGGLSLGNGGAGVAPIKPSSVVLENTTLTYNYLNDITYAGTITGPGSFVKKGDGILTYSGTASNSALNLTVSAGAFINKGVIGGTVSVATGTSLTTSAGSSIGGLVTLADGASLVIGGSTFTGGLKLGSTSSGVINVSFTAKEATGGAVTTTAASVLVDVVPLSGSFPTGGGTLLLFTSTADVDLTKWEISAESQTRSVPILTHGGSNNLKQIWLGIADGAPGALRWSATVSGNWNNNNAASWYNVSTSSANDKFYALDSVTFPNDASLASAVVLTGAVAPTTLVVDSQAANINYTFSGTGAIVGSGALTKNGDSTLTIENTGENIYSGGTVINDGKIIAKVSTAYGTGNLRTAGSGVAAFALGASAASVGTPIPLASGESINISVESGFYAKLGAFQGVAGGTLHKTGDGTLSFDDADPLKASYANASLTLDGGTVELSKNNGFGGTIALNTGLLKLVGTGGNLIADTATITLAGGILDINGKTENIGSIANIPDTTGKITNSSATFVALSIAGGSFSGGRIENGVGKVRVDKLGMGTLDLTGAKNTFLGNLQTGNSGGNWGGWDGNNNQRTSLYIGIGAVEVGEWPELGAGDVRLNPFGPTYIQTTSTARSLLTNDAGAAGLGLYGPFGPNLVNFDGTGTRNGTIAVSSVNNRIVIGGGGKLVYSGTGPAVLDRVIQAVNVAYAEINIPNADATLFVADIFAWNGTNGSPSGNALRKTGDGTLFLGGYGMEYVTNGTGTLGDGYVTRGKYGVDGSLLSLSIYGGEVVLARPDITGNLGNNWGSTSIYVTGGSVLRLGSVAEGNTTSDQLSNLRGGNDAVIWLSNGTFNMNGMSEAIGKLADKTNNTTGYVTGGAVVANSATGVLVNPMLSIQFEWGLDNDDENTSGRVFDFTNVIVRNTLTTNDNNSAVIFRGGEKYIFHNGAGFDTGNSSRVFVYRTNSTLVFDRSDDYNFAANITGGTGGRYTEINLPIANFTLEKRGSGTLTMSLWNAADYGTTVTNNANATYTRVYDNGTLRAGKNSVFNRTNIEVYDEATFSLNGTAQTIFGLTMEAAGKTINEVVTSHIPVYDDGGVQLGNKINPAFLAIATDAEKALVAQGRYLTKQTGATHTSVGTTLDLGTGGTLNLSKNAGGVQSLNILKGTGNINITNAITVNITGSSPDFAGTVNANATNTTLNISGAAFGDVATAQGGVKLTGSSVALSITSSSLGFLEVSSNNNTLAISPAALGLLKVGGTGNALTVAATTLRNLEFLANASGSATLAYGVTLESLTIGSGVNYSLSLSSDGEPDLTTPSLTASNLTNSGGSVSFSIAGILASGVLAGSTFTLLDYSNSTDSELTSEWTHVDGALSSGHWQVPVSAGMRAGAVSLSNNVTGPGSGTLTLDISGIYSLVWFGADGTDGMTWGAGAGSTANWRNVNDLTSTVEFYAGDTVLFNGTAQGVARTIMLAGDLLPSRLTVDGGNSGTPVDFTFGGTGRIAGDVTLTKIGAGILTINNANTYTGGTDIQGGTVVVGNSGSLGTGAITLHDGTTLNATAAIPANALVVAGNVTFALANGALTLANNFSGTGNLNITGTGARTFTGTNSSGFTGTLTHNGYGITFSGANANWGGTNIVSNDISGANIAFSGTGTMKFGSLTFKGGNISIASSSTLDIARITRLDDVFTTSLITRGNDDSRLTSSTGKLALDVAESRVVELQVRMGNGTALEKYGAGTLVLNNITQTFVNGGLHIFEGTVEQRTMPMADDPSNSIVLEAGTKLFVYGSNFYGGWDGANNANRRRYPLTVKYGAIVDWKTGGDQYAVGALTLIGGTLSNTKDSTGNPNQFALTGNVSVLGNTDSNFDIGTVENPTVSTLTARNDRGFSLGMDGNFSYPTFTVEETAKLVVNTMFQNGQSGNPASGFTKTGLGEMELTSPTASVNTGAITLAAGTLSFSADNQFGNGGALILQNGTLRYNGNNGGVGRAITVTNAAIDVPTQGNTLTLTGTLTGASSATLTKKGPGTLSIGGNAAGFTGAVAVEKGTVSFVNLPTLAKINVSGGGVLDVGGSRTLELANSNISYAGHDAALSGAPANDIIGSLKLSGTHTLSIGTVGNADVLKISNGLNLSNGKLAFDVSEEAASDLVTLTGGFTLTGANTFSFNLLDGSGTILPPGSYDLIKVGGAVSGDLNSIALSGLTPTALLTNKLVLDGGTIRLVVDGTDEFFTWNATGSSTNTWTQSSTNWLDESNAPVFAPEFGNVRFDDTGYSQVEITEVVKPYRLLVTGAQDYTLIGTGTGKISGSAGLFMEGTGTFTLEGNANDFNGAITLSDGVLAVNTDGTVPAIANKGVPSLLGKGHSSGSTVGGIVFNGGTLRLNTATATTTDRSFTVTALGGVLEVAAARVTFNSTETVALTGAGPHLLTLSGAGEGVLALPLANDIGGATLALAKTGNGTWWLSRTGNTFSGGVTVSAGTLALATNTAAGAGVISLAGGVLTNLATNGASVDISLANAINPGLGKITVSGGNLTLTGTFGNTGSALTKDGSGLLTLSSLTNNSYTGGVNLTAGNIVVTQQNALGNGTDYLASGTRLQLDTSAATSGNLTGTGTAESILTTGTTTLTVNSLASSDDTFSGTIADGTATLNLAKTGTGKWTLATANTYSGTTRITGGILSIGLVGALGTSTDIAISGAGTLDFGALNLSGKTVSIAGAGFDGTGALQSTNGAVAPVLVLTGSATIADAGTTTLSAISGTGTLTFATHTATAGVFVAGSAGLIDGPGVSVTNNATLSLTASNALVTGTAVTLGSGGALKLDGTGVGQTLSALSGSGSVNGTGTLTLDVPTETAFSGTLDGSANLTLAHGKLVLDNSGSTTTGTLRIASGTTLSLEAALAASGAADVLGNRTASTVELAGGTLEFAAAVPSQTARVLTLADAQATLRATGESFLWTSAGSLAFASGVTDARLFLDATGANAYGINAALGDNGSLGTLALTKTGTGTWTLGGANTFSGGVNIENGTLALTSSTALPTGNAVRLGATGSNTSGTLQLNGNSVSLGALIVVGNGLDNRVVNGTAAYGALTLAIAASVNPTVYSGALGRASDANANAFSFTKAGDGELVLSGAMTYTGETRVSAGKLTLVGSTRPQADVFVDAGAQLDVKALAGSNLFITPGRTLTAGSSGTAADLLGTYTLSGGTLAAGDFNTPATRNILTLDGKLSVAAPSVLEFIFSDELTGLNNSFVHATSLDFGALLTLDPVLLNGYFALGTYPLFEYDTSFEGSLNNLALVPSSDPRYVFTIRTDANRILLDVESTQSETPLYWRGQTVVGGSATWDAVVPNFSKEGGTDSFFTGSTAIFGNDADTFNINVGTGVVLGAVVFNNDTAHTYTITGGASGEGIRGTGYIEKHGTGRLELLSENSYVGILDANNARMASTLLISGTIAVGHDRALGTGEVRIAGGTLEAVGNIALANDVTFANGTRAVVDSGTGTFTLTGKLTGGTSTQFSKNGTGTLDLAGDGTGFSGRLDGTDGTLRLSDVNLSAAAINLSASNVQLVVNGGTSKVGALSGVAGSIVTGTGELQVGARGAVGVTFAGDLTGTFTLAKVGAGTLVLTGNNSAHNGVWDVRLGRLQIGDGVTAGVTTGTGSLSIADGATVAINLPGNETLSRTLSGGGVLEKLGTGTLTANQPNDTFSGTVRVSAGTLALGGAGNFGTATIEANATVLLGGSGDYVFANNITGTGSLVKDGGTTTATWLGSGNVNVEVRAGTLAIGNGTDALQQTQLATTTLADGATLRIAPVGDGTVTLGDIIATGTGRVEKEGDGTAVLIGAVKAQGGIAVNEGELSLGNGTGRSVLQVTGPIYVASAAALSVSRIGETRITGAVTGEGDLLLSGDNNGAGTTVLLSTDNQLSGTVHLSRHAVLQVGDTGAASRLTDSSPLDVQIESGATLRFTQTTAPETGSTLAIGGDGTVEYAGTGSLAFSDGTASTFAGTLLASAGTFVFDAATLPAATLNATGAGILRIESDAPVTTLAPTFGAGDGTIALGAAPDAGGFVRYGFSNAPVFGGTLAVSAQTELRLSGETLTAQTVQVQRDAFLTGTGTISGVLHNAQGGTLSPGSGSAGQILVQGDFTNEGALVIAVDSLNSTSAVHYTGTARVNPATSTVQLQMTPALYELFLLGAEIKILVDDQPTGGKADVLGSFRPQNISVDDGTGEIKVGYAIAYDAGSGGMSIIHLNNLGDLPKLHDGLRGFANALSELVLNGGSSSELIALMSAPNPRIAIENASPLALSSLTAMPINSAQEDFTNLHAHLESLRFSRGATGGQVGSQPYITVTGNYVRNGTGASDPVYNFNTYGAMVGFDQAAGEQFIVGLNAAYHHGKADFSHGGGTAKHDNGRLNFYGTWVASDYVYVDATVFAGYSTNDVKQITALGTTKSKPKGYDFGGSVYTGGIVPLSDTLHLTPYVGFEYVYANVDGVRQTVVDVSKFDQDSLRVKIGTGLSWLVPTQADFSVRVSFDVSFAHELLDTDAALNARFAGDPTGRKFRVDAAALPENSLQVGPAVEFGFDNNKSVQFGYRLEHDLKNQTTHHLNASFRMRF